MEYIRDVFKKSIETFPLLSAHISHPSPHVNVNLLVTAPLTRLLICIPVI